MNVSDWLQPHPVVIARLIAAPVCVVADPHLEAVYHHILAVEQPHAADCSRLLQALAQS
jgi:hypothetical protein